MQYFKVEENGETYWTGTAYSADDALEKCYDDGGPGSLINITLFVWKKVKVGSFHAEKWVEIYTGKYCAD